MSSIKSKAKLCFDSLYIAKENSEHLAISIQSGNSFFGSYLAPSYKTTDEAKQYVQIRLNSLSDKSDRIAFLDYMFVFLKENERYKLPNEHTARQVGLDKVSDWQSNYIELQNWISNELAKMGSIESKPHYEKLSDLFVHEKNLNVILSLLESVNPPVISNGSFSKKHKGSITALVEVIYEKKLLRDTLDDNRLAQLINNEIEGLNISGRTLRNPGTKEYKSYIDQFKHIIGEAIQKKEILM